MPSVSVIIPTRDRTELLIKALESVLASSGGLEVEILLVDDGSTDATRLAVRDYPVRYLRGPQISAAAARNVGLRAATGSYVTFLDDDDLWPENNLLSRVEFLERNAQYGATCSRVILTDEEGNITSPPYPDPPLKSGRMFNDFIYYIPQLASLLVRRDYVQKVGEFDESLHGGEDWDWALRLARTCQIGFLREISVFWRIHDASRFEGPGERQIEDISWRRYNDVMKVAQHHLNSASGIGWLERQRALLKHRGAYIHLFTRYGWYYARRGRLLRAALCFSRAVRISPLHVISHGSRLFKRKAQKIASANTTKRICCCAGLAATALLDGSSVFLAAL